MFHIFPTCLYILPAGVTNLPHARRPAFGLTIFVDEATCTQAERESYARAQVPLVLGYCLQFSSEWKDHVFSSYHGQAQQIAAWYYQEEQKWTAYTDSLPESLAALRDKTSSDKALALLYRSTLALLKYAEQSDQQENADALESALEFAYLARMHLTQMQNFIQPLLANASM